MSCQIVEMVIKRNTVIGLVVVFMAGTYFFYSFLIFRSFTIRYFFHIQLHLVFIGFIELLCKSVFIYLQWKLLASLTKRGKYAKLIAGSAILLSLSFGLEYFTRKFFYPDFVGFQIRQFPVWAFNLAEYLICLFAVTSFFYLREWKRSEMQKRELIQHQLSTELEFLKQQINPHFLFNTLSSLFSYAQKYGSRELQQGLLKFSDFLRYSIYDTAAKTISLSKRSNTSRIISR